MFFTTYKPSVSSTRLHPSQLNHPSISILYYFQEITNGKEKKLFIIHEILLCFHSER